MHDSMSLHLHPLVGALFMSLPKDKRNVLTKAISGPDPDSALFTGVRTPMPGAVSLENPFKGVDQLTYLTALGQEVSDRLQHYVNDLTEIK